jgi:hypothetical protein
MRRVVQIEDIPDGVFAHPTEVLSQLVPEAADLHWTVLDLREAFAPADSSLDVLALQREVEASATGVQMRFDELVRLAAGLQQVVDGLFVGCATAAEFPGRTDPDAVILERAVMTVAAVDSSFWLVSGPEEVLDRLSARFERVTERDASDVTLSAWDR